ncbi:MAG TPA: LacI family DNA-binding transcriptional regulator [Opitutaceae bacterium]
MPSKKIRTMEEFAEVAGLSRPTVSKYFHDPSTVRGVTRQRIEAALKRHDFRPNLFAVNLNRRRSKIIGLIVPDQVDPFYMALTRRIEVRAGEAGYLAFVLSSDGKPDLEEKAIKTFSSLNVAGAIVAPLGVRSHRSRIRTLAKSIPLIFMDSRLDEGGPFVGTNNRQSISLMTDYLSRSGERPTYFDMPHVNTNAIERRAAYIEAMTSLGLEPTFAPVKARDNWAFEQYAFDETLRILGSRSFPTNTLLCANDRLAFGVMAGAFQAGLKVGREPDCNLRVAGHDNHPLSAFTCPPLTTVSQNYGEIGRRALDLLFERIGVTDGRDGETPADGCILLNAELVLRKSA